MCSVVALGTRLPKLLSSRVVDAATNHDMDFGFVGCLSLNVYALLL